MMINKRLIGTVSESKKYIAGNVAFQWCSLAANIVMMTSITCLLQNLFLHTAGTREFAVTSVVAVAAVIVRFLCSIGALRMGYLSSRAVKKILREKIYRKLLKLGSSYNQQVQTSEVVQVAVEGVDQLETYFGAYLPQFFYAMLAPLTLFLYLAFVSLSAAVVLLICVPLIPVAIAAVQTWAKKLLSQYWGEYTALGDTFLENLQGLTTLKIYQADGFKNEEMNIQAERFRKITMKVLTMQLNSITIMDLIAYGGAALGVIMAATQYAAGHVALWGCLLIILLSADFFIPMRQLGSFFHIAMNGMAASDKIFRLLDLPEEGQVGTQAHMEEGQVGTQAHMEEGQAGTQALTETGRSGMQETLEASQGRMQAGLGAEQDKARENSAVRSVGTLEVPPDCDIMCSNIHFSYEPDSEILHGVNMQFPQGGFTALVGESGCGKSTAASILMGRNKGYTGSVKVGGVPLPQISESSLMENFTYVSHQSYLFKGTVRDNLLMGKPDATEGELWEVLEKTKLAGFLQSEKGLDTLLAEKGSNFSGGQCQRLALARALLHDSPVYIFDEATSNIDVESENDIMEQIHRLAETRTVILISHRLANVVAADNIYVMEAGRVTESGTHEELLAQGGVYVKLWNAQQSLENYRKGGE